MPLYRAKGVLTGTIEPENVAQADAYLREHDMTEFLDDGLDKLVEHIEWKLESDGHNWTVTVFAPAPLSLERRKQLSEWVSGQNSDGLGESFEQQDFAWDTDGECGECDDCQMGWGSDCSEQGGRMISFDWQTNDIVWERVK